MFCKKCGTENPDEYSFCRNCGFPLMKAESEVREPEASPDSWRSSDGYDDRTVSSSSSMGGADHFSGGSSYEDDRTVAMSREEVLSASSRLSEERRDSETGSGAPVSYPDGGRHLLPKQYKPVSAPAYFFLALLFSFGVAALYIVFTFIYGGQKNEVLKAFWNDHFLVMIIILGVCAACFVINLLLAMVPRRVPVKSFARAYLIIFLVNAALLAGLAVLMHKDIIHYDVFSKLQTFFMV